MFNFLGGLWGKVIAGIGAAGLFLIGILTLQSRAKQDERNRIEAASGKEEVKILKRRKKIHDQVQSDGSDAAFDRMRERASRKRDD